MAAVHDVRVARSSRDIAEAAASRREADRALERIRELERRIRHMTRIYQERLDGRRTNDER